MLGVRGRAAVYACLTVVPLAGARAGTLFDLHGGSVSLELAGPASGNMSSGAALNVDLANVSMSARASASAGLDKDHSALWHKQGAQVAAHLSGPAGTVVSAQGTDELSYTYRDPASIGDPGTATHLIATDDRSVSLSGSVPLVDGARVEAGVVGTSSQTADASVPHPAQHNSVGTQTQEVYARVRWRARGVGVEAGVSAHSADISWQAKDTRDSAYNSVDPKLQVSLSPWSGTSLTTSYQQTVAPYDTAAFTAYANAAQPGEGRSFRPDHTWRFRSRLEQKLGPATASVSYSADRSGTATEFGQASNGQQVPTSTPLLERDSVDLAVSVPLTGLGLPDTSMNSQASWQDSRVVDPVTNAMRAASGEIPHRLSFRLSHRMPASHLRFGITGDLDGAHSSYQVSEISAASAGGTMGAFVAFTPGPYEVDLNVNGIGGASTTDYFYSGTRANSFVSRIADQAPPGPAVSLSLHKSF